MVQETVEKKSGVKIEEIPTHKVPIDIIVPSHNNVGLLGKCVNTIYKNTTVPFHLVVCDDSTDMTPLYLAQIEKEHDNITCLHVDTPYKTGNQFFNHALEHCKNDYVATVMNSILVEHEWELVALEILRRNPKVATVGLKCLFPWGTIESAGIAFNGFIPTDIGVHFPAHRQSGTYPCEAVQWAFALHRTEALRGNLEENTFHGFVGWDDIDNCFVLRKKGWGILYNGVGCGYHEPRATRGRDDEAGQKLNRENAVTFWKRWGYWEKYPQCHNVNLNGQVRVTPETLEAPVNRAQRRRALKTK